MVKFESFVFEGVKLKELFVSAEVKDLVTILELVLPDSVALVVFV